MGIFNFMGWFNRRFPRMIHKLNDSIDEVGSGEIVVDNLLFDVNGIIHNSSQKIYKYGNFKPPYEVFVKDNLKNQHLVFQDVCETLEKIIIMMRPSKRVILAIDGCAPQAKLNQQRSRRYKSSLERDPNDKSFNNICITPGTKFMDHLSKYIDWFIRKQISTSPFWRDLEIVYSSANVPQEGEHKLMCYLRKYGKNTESYCLQGLDGDLIMLGLSSHLPKFYILREDLYDPKNNFLFIDIGEVRNELVKIMEWSPEINEDRDNQHKFHEESAINDFVFLCFMVGNDFLPHIPSLEILEGGIDVIIDSCREVGSVYGHIVVNHNGNLQFSKRALQKFLEIISGMEKTLLEQKFKNRKRYFEDELLTKCSFYNGEYHEIDIKNYREQYCMKYFGKEDQSFEEFDSDCELVAKHYLTGLQWVLTYYSKSVPSWKWLYPFHYAPPASLLIKYISKFETPRFRRCEPCDLFEQLLYVIPPTYHALLPKPLDHVLKTSMIQYYPENVEIDVSGKKQEYQGVVCLPFIDAKSVKKIYDDHVKRLEKKESFRNQFAKNLVYRYKHHEPKKIFRSFYGDIEVNVHVDIINL